MGAGIDAATETEAPKEAGAFAADPAALFTAVSRGRVDSMSDRKAAAMTSTSVMDAMLARVCMGVLTYLGCDESSQRENVAARGRPREPEPGVGLVCGRVRLGESQAAARKKR